MLYVANEIVKLWLYCTDILLCHDDELDTRRVAFALYLTPSWSKEDGGLLDLFDMDGQYTCPRIDDTLMLIVSQYCCFNTWVI